MSVATDGSSAFLSFLGTYIEIRFDQPTIFDLNLHLPTIRAESDHNPSLAAPPR